MSDEPDGIEDSEHPGQESDPNPENTDSNAAIQPFLNPHVDVPVLCPSTLATATVPTQTSTGVAESGAEVAHVRRSRNSGSHRRRKNNRPEQRAAAKNANGSDHGALPEKIVKRIKLSSEVVRTELVTKDLAVAHGGYEGRGGYIKGYTVPVSPSKGLGMGLLLVKIDPTR